MKSSSRQSTWKSPSNIALVKYWGKKDFQIPANASISFTLDACHTKTTLKWKEKLADKDQSIRVFVDNQETPDFLPKVEKLVKILAREYINVNNFDFDIYTSNTFPHSSGIASSASGMSALALCLTDFLIAEGESIKDRLKFASDLARKGSGSACRSIFGGMVEWGKHPEYEGSSDLFATAVTNAHTVFSNYCDTILIVHEGQKDVSSTVGHNLLNNHPFAEKRFEIANNRMAEMKDVLSSGNLSKFIEIVEAEALMLHAMMMTSSPDFILMKPNTLAIIEAIRRSRKLEGHHICFTLDAGANVHMLYPKDEEPRALKLLEEELVVFCENRRYICDRVGTGPIPTDA